MARKQKSKPVQTDAQIFSEYLKKTCDQFGTSFIAHEMGVTIRSVQVWKNDASRMNKISLMGANQLLKQIWSNSEVIKLN